MRFLAWRGCSRYSPRSIFTQRVYCARVMRPRNGWMGTGGSRRTHSARTAAPASPDPDVSDQVGHVLRRESVLKTIRHERKARTGQLFDVAAQDRFVRPAGVSERDAVRRLCRDDAADFTIAFCEGSVTDVFRFEGLVRVEDGD